MQHRQSEGQRGSSEGKRQHPKQQGAGEGAWDQGLALSGKALLAATITWYDIFYLGI